MHHAGIGLFSGLDIPVYQDSFMRIASMDPYKGYRRHPINVAIKGALGHLCWSRPGQLKRIKAA